MIIMITKVIYKASWQLIIHDIIFPSIKIAALGFGPGEKIPSIIMNHYLLIYK